MLSYISEHEYRWVFFKNKQGHKQRIHSKVFLRGRQRKRESICVCVCVTHARPRARARARVCVCVCVCVSVLSCVRVSIYKHSHLDNLEKIIDF